MNSKNVQENDMASHESIEEQSIAEDGVGSRSGVFAAHKRVIITVLGLFLCLAAVLSLLFWNRNSVSSPGIQDSSESAALFSSDLPVVCTVLGFHNLQCEDVNTQELVKYVLPNEFYRLSTAQSSPDGTMFIISYTDDKQVYKQAVVDSEFHVVQTLIPSVEQSTESSLIYNQYVWLADSKTIAKTTSSDVSADGVAPDTFVTILDAVKPDTKVAGPFKIESRIGAGDSIVGGYSDKLLLKRFAEYDAESSMSKPDELYWVDITNSEAKLLKIDTSEMFYENGTQKAIQGLSVSIDTLKDVMYVSGSSRADDSSQPFFGVGTIVDMKDGSKTLVAGGIPIVRPYALYSSGLIRTTQGLLIDETNDLSKIGAPVILTPAGDRQNVKLGISSQIYFSMSKMPGLERSGSNEPEIKDFLQASVDVPASIRSFIEGLVTKDCAANMYRSVEVVKYVNDEQFMTYEGGCGRDAAFFYILKGEGYEEVFATQEGIDCEQRDKLGISSKLTDCRLPGEGL